MENHPGAANLPTELALRAVGGDSKVETVAFRGRDKFSAKFCVQKAGVPGSGRVCVKCNLVHSRARETYKGCCED